MNALNILMPLGMLTESLEMALFDWFHLDLFDLIFVMTAVVFNLQIIGIYIAGKQKNHAMIKRFGTIVLALSIPFAVVFMNHLGTSPVRWITVGFCFIFLYLFVELLFDFILKIEFRSNPLLHIPYIILFYIVQIALITIAFSIDTVSGYLVSISFWALLISLIYALWPGSKAVLRHGE